MRRRIAEGPSVGDLLYRICSRRYVIEGPVRMVVIADLISLAVAALHRALLAGIADIALELKVEAVINVCHLERDTVEYGIGIITDLLRTVVIDHGLVDTEIAGSLLHVGGDKLQALRLSRDQHYGILTHCAPCGIGHGISVRRSCKFHCISPLIPSFLLGYQIFLIVAEVMDLSPVGYRCPSCDLYSLRRREPHIDFRTPRRTISHSGHTCPCVVAALCPLEHHHAELDVLLLCLRETLHHLGELDLACRLILEQYGLLALDGAYGPVIHGACRLGIHAHDILVTASVVDLLRVHPELQIPRSLIIYDVGVLIGRYHLCDLVHIAHVAHITHIAVLILPEVGARALLVDIHGTELHGPEGLLAALVICIDRDLGILRHHLGIHRDPGVVAVAGVALDLEGKALCRPGAVEALAYLEIVFHLVVIGILRHFLPYHVPLAAVRHFVGYQPSGGGSAYVIMCLRCQHQTDHR